MMRYRINPPDGQEFISEMNEEAVLLYLSRGCRLEVLGLSPIAARVRATREAAELLALDNITDDQHDRATSLLRQHGITADDLNAYHAAV